MTATNKHGIRVLPPPSPRIGHLPPDEKAQALADSVARHPSSIDLAAAAVIRRARAAVHGRYNKKSRADLSEAVRYLNELERRG